MADIFSSRVRSEIAGQQAMDLRVEGMKCASCALKVQTALKEAGANEAQVDLASGRVSVGWAGEAALAPVLAAKVAELGYGVAPYEVAQAERADADEAASLARFALVSGVATLLVMPLAMAAPGLIWVAAAMTVGVLLYAGRPFFGAAVKALAHGHVNMDVPVSAALALTMGMSLTQIAQTGHSGYLDSVTMLLFFLLIGRYLDRKARGRAREAATRLLSLLSGTATVLEGDTARTLPLRDLVPDMVLLVAAGEKIAADGEVTQGESEVDASIITGETLPQKIEAGSPVFAGMVNLIAPVHVRVSAASEDTLLGEVIRLMQRAQQSHARYVRIADRMAALYTPAVFALALATFLGWWLAGGKGWDEALFTATTVLIITCPCAMGLAVPAVQVLASSRLFEAGILVKASDALERLAGIDAVVFDKTGTLTLGQPKLTNRADITTEELKYAAALALASHHPLAKAVVAAHGPGPVYAGEVTEYAGQGLEGVFEGETVRLGRREWCGPAGFPADDKMEMWLRFGYRPPLRLTFADDVRADAGEVIGQLKKAGLSLWLLSGDRAPVVADVAQRLGFDPDQVRAHLTPAEKCQAIETLRQAGHRVLMVGDGLNDAAALSSADVSLSPATALDLTQTAASMVFQGERLGPVWTALTVARKADRLVKENFALSFLYNLLAVPLAMAGLATPLIAAAAMSLSSLTVVLNAQRIRGPKRSGA